MISRQRLSCTSRIPAGFLSSLDSILLLKLPGKLELQHLVVCATERELVLHHKQELRLMQATPSRFMTCSLLYIPTSPVVIVTCQAIPIQPQNITFCWDIISRFRGLSQLKIGTWSLPLNSNEFLDKGTFWPLQFSVHSLQLLHFQLQSLDY